jgi:hypothetical protein
MRFCMETLSHLLCGVLSEAERYWDDAFAAAAYAKQNQNPTWTLETVGIALNPPKDRERHHVSALAFIPPYGHASQNTR